MKLSNVMFCLTLFLSVVAHAREHRDHAVHANIGTVLIGNYEVAYDYRLDKRVSISTSAIYYDSRKVFLRVYSLGYSIALGFMPKVHFFGKAHHNSFYVAPSLRTGLVVHPASGQDETTDRSILTRIGANFGYQHVFDFGLLIDVLTGVEHYYGFDPWRKPTRYQSSGEGKLRFDLRPYIAISCGFAF